MAIQNSESRLAKGTRFLQSVVLIAILWASQALGRSLEEAEQRFQQAKAALRALPKDPELGWKFAAACFQRADFARSSGERAKLAEQGIAAAREVLERNPDSIQGLFYLAVNLGQLARTRTLTALGIVSEMERQLLAAIAIDPKFNHAAPERTLGMLYLEAPGWPTSVGSRSKARLHLQRAADLDPEYPENWLTLMEAEFKWGERKKVQVKLAEADKRLVPAKAAWIAAEGEESWKEILSRVAKLRQQAFSTPPPVQGSAKR